MNTSRSLQQAQEAIIQGDIPDIVKYVLTYALDLGASDVHIEPWEFNVGVRLRIDGTLMNIIEFPSNIHTAVVSRVKIQSGLKIDEQRRPQDGRLKMTTDDRRDIELRVSTLPTLHGEKVCMRLQDKNQTIPPFADLGITGNNFDRLTEMVSNPNGINLVTGPTGSGKTTTLYSAMHQLNKPDINIMTFEDPVEYEMPGLNQSQVKSDIGYDFASGLRTALRQDPDIIMVGEIRDQETIEIAIKAALTGHMVLSTIHTNSAVSTITRLLDMGMADYKITATMRTIQAQRLVKCICPHCKQAYEPDEKIRETIRKELSRCRDRELDHAKLDEPFQLYKGAGCEACGNTGYKGRTGVYEVLAFDRELEESVLAGELESKWEDIAVANGMVTLLQDGYIKAINGVTTVEQVYKVATMEH